MLYIFVFCNVYLLIYIFYGQMSCAKTGALKLASLDILCHFVEIRCCWIKYSYKKKSNCFICELRWSVSYILYIKKNRKQECSRRLSSSCFVKDMRRVAFTYCQTWQSLVGVEERKQFIPNIEKIHWNLRNWYFTVVKEICDEEQINVLRTFPL